MTLPSFWAFLGDEERQDFMDQDGDMLPLPIHRCQGCGLSMEQPGYCWVCANPE